MLSKLQVVSYALSVTNVLVILFFVYHMFIHRSNGHGGMMSLEILFLAIALPLFILGLLFTLIFVRETKPVLVSLLPLVFYFAGYFYDRTQYISYFNPKEYQYLIGKNIKDLDKLNEKVRSGTSIGEHTENGKLISKKFGFPGMTIVLDEKDTIIQVIPSEE